MTELRERHRRVVMRILDPMLASAVSLAIDIVVRNLVLARSI